MKLLLHYLKFDLLAWSSLLKMLWLLVPAFIGLMTIIAGWRTPEDKIVFVQMAVSILYAAGAVVFGFICLFAGGTDSSARAKTWIMTRPRHGRARAGSRVLIILGGAVLPVLVAWWGTLLVMGFDAASMAAQFPRVLCTALAIAAALALLGLLPLCVPGVIIGALPGFLPLLALLVPAIRPFRGYYAGDPDALTVALACVAGLLTALPAVWRRLTRREWALQGFLCGLTAVTAMLVFFPVLNWLAFRQPYTELLALRDLEEWQLTRSPEKEVIAIPDHSRGVSIQVPLARDARFEGRQTENWMVHAFSWRRDADSEWSPWIPQQISFRPVGDIMLLLECEASQIGDMNGGDLRLLSTVPTELRSIPAPTGEGTVMTGRGWRLEISPLEITDDRVTVNFMRRRLPGIPQNALTVDLWAATSVRPTGYTTGGWTGGRAIELPWLSVDWAGQSAGFRGAKANPPERLQVKVPEDRSSVRLLRVAGITLRAPRAQPKDEPAAPPRKSIWPDTPAKPERYANMEAASAPWPLTDSLIPPLPEGNATDAEVARYLHQLIGIAERREHVNGMAVVLREQQFTPLVQRWLPLILRLAEHKRYNTPTVVLTALEKATTGEQRKAILSRLPYAPVLMRVVIQRNWLTEARPYVIEAVLRDGQIPSDPDWLEALLHYAEPSLAPLLRKQWRPVKIHVQLWEQIPELAAELPAKLEEMRDYVRSIGTHPDMRDDSVIEALLYAGDPVGLEVLLRLVRADNRFGQFLRVARDHLRAADGKQLAWDVLIPSFIGDSTAADYRFDREQRVWCRNSPQP